MGGFKDEFDDLEEDTDVSAESDGDDFSFDDDDEEGGKSGKKNKSEGGGFNRDSYYFYKDKLVQLSGTIRPKERKEGKVVSLDFKTEDKIYTVVLDDMGKKLMNSCYQELLVTGLVSKVSEKEYTIAIKTYI
jgi:hypothetical protein